MGLERNIGVRPAIQPSNRTKDLGASSPYSTSNYITVDPEHTVLVAVQETLAHTGTVTYSDFRPISDILQSPPPLFVSHMHTAVSAGRDQA